MVDLNVIVEELENKEYSEEAGSFTDVLEFSKNHRNGSQDVFILDFNDYTVTKNHYNANGAMQHDATKNFTIKHSNDLNSVMQSIV